MITGCIYVHKNLINNKYYIGQTIKANPEKRWQNGSGYKTSSKFYRAIQKYGWENFEHIILETEIPITLLNEKEAYWIKYYNSIENGYNILPGGNNHLCTEEIKRHIREGWTKELRNKQSERYTGNGNPMYNTHRTGKSAPRQTAVVCINTGKFFHTIKEASDWSNSGKGIFYVLKGVRKTAGKHPETKEPLLWRYATEEEKEKNK